MVVRLAVQGNVLCVSPWRPEVLQSVCTARRRERIVRQPGRPAPKNPYRFINIPLYEANNGQATVHAGLIPRIVKALDKAGLAHEFENNWEPLPDPEFATLRDTSLRAFQPEVLAAICASHFGIIECATAFGKSFIITQLCRIYPGIRILVTSSSKSVVMSLYDRITEVCDRKVAKCSGTHTFKPDCEICVCVDKSLHKIPHDWPDLLLYDEVHESAAPTVSVELVRFSSARRFGFSATPTGRSDCADRMVEALFGPSIVTVSYQAAEAAGIVTPIRVGMVQVPSDIKITVKNEIKKKQHGYWRHPYRNEVIARAARAFHKRKVLIFVEKIEHALRLLKLLPDYVVVHAGCGQQQWKQFVIDGIVEEDQDDARKPNEPDIRKSFADGGLTKVICTTVWKQGVDFPDLPVLIRADGQSGEIPSTQIVGRLSRIAKDKPYACVIDFEDGFGQWYQARADKRMAVYRNHGWDIRRWDP